MTDETPTQLVNQLAQESFGFDATSRDPERNCWLVVHRHVHGMLPSEYDIREIDELLLEAVLARRKAISAAAAGDLGDQQPPPEMTERDGRGL